MSGICAVRSGEGQPVAPTLGLLAGGLAVSAGEQSTIACGDVAGVAVCAAFPTQQLFDGETIRVACDADLYNEKDLREQVGGKKASSTAALIAALYERYGAEFVGKLRGAFAIVLWDTREERIVAAVDRFAIKRLVYCESGGNLLIASRLEALVRSGMVPRDINPHAIANYLNFTVNLAPETIFSKVQRLIPGGLMIAAGQNLRVTAYWDMRYSPSGTSEAQLSTELVRLVEESVALHCKEDSLEQTGAFLSGGTDSSTVVGMMSRLGRGRVQAFSIGFKEERFDEMQYARLAAKTFNAEHFTYTVTAGDCLAALPGMVRGFDEPFGNSSAIPTYFCAKLAAAHGVKVLLAGDGGDELFGGNERYLVDRMFEVYQGVPSVLRRGIVEPLLSVIPFKNGLVGKARKYVRRSNTPNPLRYFRHNFLCAHDASEIFAGDFLQALAGYSVLELPARYYARAPARDHLDRLLYTDVKITLGDSDLPKVTCMSELAGVVTRFPLLDHTVAEMSGRVPVRLKVKGFEKRYLFKRAFGELLPKEILRKKKHGFGIPVSTWLKSDPRLRELARDTLFSGRALGRGYFRRDFMEELFRQNEADPTTYYGDILWTFFVLELWHGEHADALREAAA